MHLDWSPFARWLLQAGVILVAARFFGLMGRFVGQPLVIGEVIAGIVLGPTVLGAIAPGLEASLFPPGSLSNLTSVANVGLMLFMFVVGLEVDWKSFSGLGKVALSVSLSGMAAPFGLGLLGALIVHPSLAPPGVPFWSFALFLGVAMAVTAFPVLARILSERSLGRTRIGMVALASAAVDDVAAWCLLAFVVAVVKAADAASAVWTVVLALAFLATMASVVRPALHFLVRVLPKDYRVGQGTMAAALLGLCASCLTTEVIGIHALFGAFALGAAMPRERGVAQGLVSRLEDVVVVLFLPLFFASSGLRTQIGLVDGTHAWLLCGLLLLLAVLGKLGGASVAARLSGLPWRESLGVGVLMNTRGLMELVVLNVGLDLGVITPQLFTMLVLMAVVTTAATSPLLATLERPQAQALPADVATEPPTR